MDFNNWATGCGYNPAGKPAKKCKLPPRRTPLCLGFLVINACNNSNVQQYQMFVQQKDTTPGVWKNLLKIYHNHPGSYESGSGVVTYTGINDATILDTKMVGSIGKAHVEHVKNLLRTIMAPDNLITEQSQPHHVQLKYVNFFRHHHQGHQTNRLAERSQIGRQKHVQHRQTDRLAAETINFVIQMPRNGVYYSTTIRAVTAITFGLLLLGCYGNTEKDDKLVADTCLRLWYICANKSVHDVAFSILSVHVVPAPSDPTYPTNRKLSHHCSLLYIEYGDIGHNRCT